MRTPKSIFFFLLDSFSSRLAANPVVAGTLSCREQTSSLSSLLPQFQQKLPIPESGLSFPHRTQNITYLLPLYLVADWPSFYSQS